MKRLVTKTDANNNTFTFWTFIPRGKHRGKVAGAFGNGLKRDRVNRGFAVKPEEKVVAIS